MKLKYRLPIIIAFVIIFVIIAPLIIFYAQGYRYDLRRHRIVKTGIFFINSNPNRALVSINGQSYLPKWYNKILFYKDLLGLPKNQGLTPTVISNLLPDRYLVSVMKPNYQTWQKKLEIFPEQTTAVSQVQLFLEEPNVELLLPTKNQIWLSPNKNKLIFAEEKTANQTLLQLIDGLPNQSTIVNLMEISGKKVEIVGWSIDENKFLISYQLNKNIKFLIFDLIKPEKPLYLNQIFTFSPQKFQWSTNQNKILYLQNYNDIFTFNTETKTLESFFNLNFFPNSQLIDWQINENYLLWLRKDSQGLFLEKASLKENWKDYNQQAVIFSLALPVNSGQFSPGARHDFISLSAGDDFYLINVNFQEPEKSILFKSQAKNVAWQSDKQKLLFYNDFELSTAQINQNLTDSWQVSYDVIHRSSEKISQALWYPGNKWIFYTTNNSLQIIELDGRDIRNNFTLIKMERIDQLETTDRSNLVYLRGKINNQEGFFKIQIQ